MEAKNLQETHHEEGEEKSLHVPCMSPSLSVIMYIIGKAH